MKAKELAELLMENPDMEVAINCCVSTGTYDNPYPEYKSYDINDVRVWFGYGRAMLMIECS